MRRGERIRSSELTLKRLFPHPSSRSQQGLSTRGWWRACVELKDPLMVEFYLHKLSADPGAWQILLSCLPNEIHQRHSPLTALKRRELISGCSEWMSVSGLSRARFPSRRQALLTLRDALDRYPLHSPRLSSWTAECAEPAAL